MRQRKTANRRNWKEWFETRPLVVLVGAAVTVASTTAAVVTYFFEQEKKITEQSRAAESQQAKSDLAAKIKDLEGRLLSIERHVGTETIWDVNAVLVSPRQVKALGSDFTYFDDVQCYLSVPKSGAWTFKQTNELEFFGMKYGSKWLDERLATPVGKLMSGTKVACWRGPDTFKIETIDPQVPVIYAFPYVFIERVNNQKLFQAVGKVVDEQELEAKQKAAEEAKRILEEKRDEEIPIGTAPTSPSASATASTSAGGETPGSTRQSEVEARRDALNLLVNSDLVGFVAYAYISEGFNDAKFVKDASFRILDAEKKGNVFYIHSQMVAPASAKRPKIYSDHEFICIGDNEDTVLIRTGAPSTDQRPPEGAWIASWIAGLRVVSR
jgi:hypothetical protein